MKNKQKRAVIIGTMAEISMKAKLLKERLKKHPELVVEILDYIDLLEIEMLLCLSEFECLMAK